MGAGQSLERLIIENNSFPSDKGFSAIVGVLEVVMTIKSFHSIVNMYPELNKKKSKVMTSLKIIQTLEIKSCNQIH